MRNNNRISTFQKIAKTDSYNYLKAPIHHSDVEDQRKKWISGKDKDAKDAMELERILVNIKKFAKDGIDNNYKDKATYELFFEALDDMIGEEKRKKLFRIPEKTDDSKHSFEEGFAYINEAFLNFLTKEGFFNQKKTGNITIQLGQTSAGIDLGKHLFEEITQETLKDCSVFSSKIFDNENDNPVPYYNRKGQKSDNPKLYRIVGEREGKTDIRTLSGEESLKITLEPGNDFFKLNNLFKDATFSLKNYSKDTTSIELGSTNMFRVLYTTVNYFEGKSLHEDGVISFIYAIANRNKQGENEEEINEHLGHLQVIYELTGLGAQYFFEKTGNQILDEENNNLKQLLRKGVKFLVVNTYDSDDIQVFSTKNLLASLFDENSQYKHAWRNRVSIDRQILNN